MSRADMREFLRLAAISIYGLILLTIDDLNLGPRADLILGIAAALLWAGLLVDLIRHLRHSADRRRAVRQNVGYFLLLIAPLFIAPAFPWGVLILVLTGYILTLRRVAAGRAVAFSFGLVAFVMVVSTFALVRIEQADPRSKLGDFGESSAWVASTLLRLPGYRAQQPVTDDGRLLALVVGACAVLAASFFTAQIVTWLVGSQGDDNKAPVDEQLRLLTDEVASLRASVQSMAERFDQAGAPAQGVTEPEPPPTKDAP